MFLAEETVQHHNDLNDVTQASNFCAVLCAEPLEKKEQNHYVWFLTNLRHH